MKKSFLVLALVGACGFVDEARALPAPDVYPAKGGSIRITPIFHGSLQIEYRGKVIHVDPFSAGDYRGAKKADVILITHTHADHLDTAAIFDVLSDNKAVQIVAPVSAKTKLNEVEKGKADTMGPFKADILTFLGNGKKLYGSTFQIEAVPMYNIKRGPKPGAKFHPKGEFNGYILTLGGKRIYIAGDTEATPEMKALRNIDIAFLPMNLPYTMTPQEAANGARAFKPKVVYPYHYRYPFDKPNNNPQQFAQALKGSGIQVKLRGWYDNAAPK